MALEGERVKTLQFCFYTTHTYIGSGSMWNMAFQFKMAKKMKKVTFWGLTHDNLAFDPFAGDF